MENLSYISLSRQKALRSMMDVTANNMANMNTPGFKSQNMMFSEYLGKAQEDGHKVSLVKEAGSYRDLQQGTLSQTSNNLDFAIQGDGYFVVKGAEGFNYTRAGTFSLNSKGEIVDKLGHTVVGDNGSPLTVPTNAMHITMTENGTLNSERGSIGKLKLVTFADPQTLVPIGDNLLTANNAAEMPVDKPHIVQGMLETSNVQPILEMNKMIEILRMYQATQNVMNNDHDMTRSMIQKLTRI